MQYQYSFLRYLDYVNNIFITVGDENFKKKKNIKHFVRDH